VSEVVLSELAEADLTDIWVFVARDNATAADRLIDEIHEKCRFLANTPKAGRHRPEVDPSIRGFAVGNYLIFYRERATASKWPACCTAIAISLLFSALKLSRYSDPPLDPTLNAIILSG
jgi:toxin ParE1/3/4